MAGQQFAGLTIVREIGRGGAGIVYLARDESLDRLVALKILHRDSMGGDASAAERFRNEALIAAKLEHPSIIPVYASGTERGMTFLAMRYVPGRSLADAISDQGPLPIRDAVRLLRPIAAALDYAADHDIVHRDVKPANILVDESVTPRRALLSDFGIARAYEGTRHTATGGWVGTPDYIAPEILKDDTPTARSDQYSLACVLIEAISGNSPFRRSNTAATITAQLTETPDLALLPDVDSQTETALAIALEKNPDDRYATSVEFLDAVETSIGRDSNATPNTIVRKRKRNKITRRAKLAGGITLSLIAIAAAGADLLDIRNKLSSTPPPTPPAEAEAAAPQTDILILGDEFVTGSSISSPESMSAIEFKGQANAADFLVASFGEDTRTQDLGVRAVSLRKASDCDSAVRKALESTPKRAVIILDSPCVGEAFRRLRNSKSRMPIVVNLSAGIEAPFVVPNVLIEPLSTFADASQQSRQWLSEFSGEDNRASFLNLRTPSESSFGRIIQSSTRASQCTLLSFRTEVDQASELFELWQAQIRRHFSYGIGSEVSLEFADVRYETMIQTSPKTVTGSRQEDAVLYSIVESEAPGTCIAIPWEITPDNIGWFEIFVAEITKRDPGAQIFALGSPESDGMRFAEPKSFRKRFFELVTSPNLLLYSSYPYPHSSSSARERSFVLHDRWMKGPIWLFSHYDALVKAVELVAVIADARVFPRPNTVYLEPNQWASGDQDLKFPSAFGRFDPNVLEIGGDIGLLHYWDEESNSFRWDWDFTGDPGLLRAPPASSGLSPQTDSVSHKAAELWSPPRGGPDAGLNF